MTKQSQRELRSNSFLPTEGGSAPQRAQGKENSAALERLTQVGKQAAQPIPYQGQLEELFGIDFSGFRAFCGQGAEVGGAAATDGEVAVFADAIPSFEDVVHEASHYAQFQANVTQGGDPEVAADEAVDSARRGEPITQTPTTPTQDVHFNDEVQGGTGGAEGWDLDQLLDAIVLNYEHILGKQQRAIDPQFRDAADDVDDPPLWQTLLITAAEVALSAATAGIGSAVAQRCVAAAARVTADIVKKAVADAIKAGVQGAISMAAGSSSNPLEIFIYGQVETLSDSVHAAQTAMIGQRRQYEASATGQQDALQLYNAQEAVEGTVQTTQFNQTVSQWCIYLARGDMGVHNQGASNEGVNLADQIGDTSGKGVLGLEVRAYDQYQPVQIASAEIEGLNENLRNNLAGRSISQLGIPVTVHGEVYLSGNSFIDALADSRGHLRFGENEAGTVWENSNFGGLDWMYRHLHPNEGYIAGPGQRLGPSLDRMRAERYDAARHILNNEIKNKTLSQLGVSLDG